MNEYLVILEYQNHYTKEKVRSVLHDGRHPQFFTDHIIAAKVAEKHCSQYSKMTFSIVELTDVGIARVKRTRVKKT